MTSAVRTALGVFAALAFAAALVYATLEESAVTCEVCVEFGHRTACRTGSAADREQAVAGAAAAACAELASGVTRGMQCARSEPRSVRCSGD